MQDYEVMLIQAVAQDPQNAASFLMAPQSDFGLGWFTSITAKKFFSALAELYLAEEPITIMSILLRHDKEFGKFSGEDIPDLIAVWRSGLSSEKMDLKALVKDILTTAILASANKHIEKYKSDTSAKPHAVIDHIDALCSRLSSLSHSGIDYDPTPSKHRKEPRMTMRGTWGDNEVLDRMFSEKNTTDTGGRPAYGLAVASLASGAGKTTLGITMAAYNLAYTQDRVTIMSNEQPRSLYAGTIFTAIKGLYNGQINDSEIDSIMDSRLTIWGPSSDPNERGIYVNKFEQMRNILHWDKPQFAIMDAVSSVSAPIYTKGMPDIQVIEAKSEAFRNVCIDERVLMYAPGNMSEKNQAILKGKHPDELQHVMIFNTITLHNTSDYAFLGWRDPQDHWIVNIKRAKNRHGTQEGEKWRLKFDPELGIYRAAPGSKSLYLN